MARPGYRLALIATALAVVVVLLGAYTRLTHAGLGCPDWPGCYGFLAVPMSEHKQNLAALRFPMHRWRCARAGTRWFIAISPAPSGW